MTDHAKYKGVVRLYQGDSPKDVAEALNVSYSKVLRWNGELKQAKIEGTLDTLLALDEEALHVMADALVHDLPDEMKPSMDIISDVLGLQRLDAEMQATAFQLNNRIRLESMKVEHMSEILDLTNALCKLREAFFNSKSVQVNVQNNYSEGETTYGAFLSDAPGKP